MLTFLVCIIFKLYSYSLFKHIQKRNDMKKYQFLYFHHKYVMKLERHSEKIKNQR